MKNTHRSPEKHHEELVENVVKQKPARLVMAGNMIILLLVIIVMSLVFTYPVEEIQHYQGTFYVHPQSGFTEIRLVVPDEMKKELKSLKEISVKNKLNNQEMRTFKEGEFILSLQGKLLTASSGSKIKLVTQNLAANQEETLADVLLKFSARPVYMKIFL